MTPDLGRAIRQGLWAANRSWTGMLLMIGGWLVIGIVSILILVLGAMATGATGAVMQGVVEQMTNAGSEEEDVIAGAPGTEATLEQAARAEQVEGWFERAWPILLACALLVFLLGVVASLWLQGGQIGYLAKLITTQQTQVSEFWTAGGRALGPLFGAWCLTILVAGGGWIAVVGVGLLFAALSSVVPVWVLTVLGIVLALATIVGLIWLGVRLIFWYVAIVADRVGPVVGLKASFRATRANWWRSFGLLGVLMLIGVGVMAVFAVPEVLAGLLGGALGGILNVLIAILRGVANVYIGFLGAAALIRFYEDTKSAAPSESPAVSGGSPGA